MARDEIQPHFASDVPAPPKPWVAHPYTLLQTGDLVGRRAELSQLSDWVARPASPLYGAPVLSLVGIGGMGKSALAWKWFQDIAPQEVRPLAGRLWWSFSESDATIESFVIRALAYVAGWPRSRVQALQPAQREERLLDLLAQSPFLLALDGIERLLLAYARPDAATLRDEEVEDPAAAGQPGPPPPAQGREPSARSLLGMRNTADERAGSFLRKLTQSAATRTLISTRLHPAELETDTGAPLPGSRIVELAGLADDDVLALWRRFGGNGARHTLQPLFESLGNNPLPIRALAGEVSRSRDAPGDVDRWLADHPGFDPSGLPLTMRSSHVLAFVLQGIGRDVRTVLATLAGFRRPAGDRSLQSLLVGAGKTFETDSGLDAALAELEDRGLLGRDRLANRYDLHPVVRGVVWHRLGRAGRRIIREKLEAHFQNLPSPSTDKVRRRDVAATIRALLEEYLQRLRAAGETTMKINETKDEEKENEPKENEKEKILHCSFCRKSQRQVKKLIAGPQAFICDECVDICNDILAEDRILSGQAPARSIEAVLAALDGRVAGQDKAKRRLAAAFRHHYLRASQDSAAGAASHLLLLGPTGTGKSLAVRCLAESFDIPVAIVDATRLSDRSIFKQEDPFQKLLEAAGGDSDKASRGVIVIDHLDKLASVAGENPEGLRVQESLLVPLEGAKVTATWRKKELDTSRLLFVGCGDFSALLARHGDRDSDLPIDQLTRCGILPALAARFGTVIQFEPLSEADLVQVMLLGDRELLRGYQRLFEADGIAVSFTDEAVQALARESAGRPGGARRLISLLENLTLALSEDLSAGKPGRELAVDAAMVRRSLA